MSLRGSPVALLVMLGAPGNGRGPVMTKTLTPCTVADRAAHRSPEDYRRSIETSSVRWRCERPPMVSTNAGLTSSTDSLPFSAQP